MKHFLSWICLICLIFSLSACAQEAPEITTEPSDTAATGTTAVPTETTEATEPEPVETTAPVIVDNDLMNRALDLGNHVERLTDMWAVPYGSGYFEDYMLLHANPLQSAEYPLVLSAPARRITATAEGLTAFCSNAQERFGTELDTSFETAKTLDAALEQLFLAADTQEGLNAAKAAAAAVHPSLTPALTEFLSALSYAQALNQEATEKITAEKFALLQDYTYCPPATAGAGLLEMYLMHSKADFDKLRASGMVLIQAAETLISATDGLEQLTVTGEQLTVETPFGAIILGSARDDTYSDPEAMLLIDPNGNDLYEGSVAATMTLDKPISVVIDLCGDDAYTANNEDGATQGCGLLGTGLLFDLKGNDTYTAARLAQGFAAIGTGLLFDGSGNDTYLAQVSCQGAGHYGFAALADVSGDDSYRAIAYAQASAGNRAMAFLLDGDGNDTYYVEPYAAEGFDDVCYSQYPLANGNWSQGCGAGNRTLTSSYLSKGLSGGIAGLVDFKGNDTYTGGIWVMGAGYWSGVGYLLDTDGNDLYHSLYYSQGSSAHYGVGIVVDIGGDDVHMLQKEEGLDDCGEGASIGFVWDRGVGTLINDGGNDAYSGYRTYCGVAWSAYDSKGPETQDLTYAFFIDTSGDDTYGGASTNISFGYGWGGFFLDGDGTDQYSGTYTGITDGGAPTENADNCGGISIDHSQAEESLAIFSAFDRAKKAFFSDTE